LEPTLLAGLKKIQAKHPKVIGHVTARGLVGGMQVVKAGKREPDADLAHSIVERCFHKGLLTFSPVGAWGQTVKIAPPLTVSREPLEEGLAVLGEATAEAIAELEARPAANAPAQSKTGGRVAQGIGAK
jgi:4-aminobutyrate aminotransferase-like enzyme